jgi:cellulose synthase operon protein C
MFISCSSPIGAFFETRYENAMGYFNTYYNLRKTFDETVTELDKSALAIRDTNYFASLPANPNLKSKFNVIIEKASKIIQYYPRSKWVDDAIMMIGKAYYYQNEYDLAQKKFQELIDNFPNSSQLCEAKLLIARNYYNARKTSDAQLYVNGYIKSVQEAGEDDVVLESFSLLGQVNLSNGDYKKAIEQYKQAVAIDGNGYLRSLAAFQLGKCYESINDYENSNKAYLDVLEYSPDDALKFRATLSYGRTSRNLAKYEEAFKTFSNLKDEALTKEQLSQVDLEIANTYNTKTEYETALDCYEIVDSLYQRTDASAKSFYYRGMMYEYKLNDFSEAKFYYDKAKTEFSASEITPNAVKKSDAFLKYFTFHSEIKKFDSLYYFALKVDSLQSLMPDSIKDSSKVTVDTAKGSSITLPSTSLSKTPMMPSDTTKIHPDIMPSTTGSFTSSTTSHDTTKIQHGKNKETEFENLADSLSIDTGEDVAVSGDSSKQRGSSQSANKIIVSADSAANLVIKNQFELGTLFLLELDRPDSAQYWFDQVANAKHTNAYKPRAIFALAEIKRMQNDKGGMDSLHDFLINNFSSSEYALQLKKTRGIAVESQKTNLEELYEKGIALVEKNKPKEALTLFAQIYKTDSASVFSAKAIYSSGWIYENIINNNDSAKSYYKFLLDKYPNSIFAENVIGKVSVANDTSNLAKYVHIKEIIPPQPPTPKYSDTNKDSKSSDEQLDQQDAKDREDNPDEDAPEPDTDAEEPPN